MKETRSRIPLELAVRVTCWDFAAGGSCSLSNVSSNATLNLDLCQQNGYLMSHLTSEETFHNIVFLRKGIIPQTDRSWPWRWYMSGPMALSLIPLRLLYLKPCVEATSRGVLATDKLSLSTLDFSRKFYKVKHKAQTHWKHQTVLFSKIRQIFLTRGGGLTPPWYICFELGCCWRVERGYFATK